MKERFRLQPPLWPVEVQKGDGSYLYEVVLGRGTDGYCEIEGRGRLLMLGSYSYLGLLGHPDIERAARDAISRWSTGTNGVRLLAGTCQIHIELERALAKMKGAASAVTFTSGYAANISAITALVGKDDVVIADELIHASLIDAILLSRARLMRFDHNNPQRLREMIASVPDGKRILVVCDAVYSMDGSIMRLPEIADICDAFGALLMVDEAHSIGVLGETGKGIDQHFSVESGRVDLWMGTLSKTIPSTGGYIAGKGELIDLIKHQGRGFIYSAALPPPNAAAALCALDVIEKENWRIAKFRSNYARLVAGLSDLGVDTLHSEIAVVPAICGEDQAAWNAANDCVRNDVFVQAIPYPVVPRGTARLRCVATANHEQQDIDLAAEVIAAAVGRNRRQPQPGRVA